jgi:hypothetical protein
MLTTTTATSVSAATPTAAWLGRRPVWQVSYLSGLAASVVVELWGLAARAAGVPMRAAGFGSHHATAITVGMFALGTMVITFWFTFAVTAMARYAKNPAHVTSGRRCRCLPCRWPSPSRPRPPRTRPS